nr:hypothetical protein [Serratia fonticola]
MNRDLHLISNTMFPVDGLFMSPYPLKMGQLSAIALKHDKIGFFAYRDICYELNQPGKAARAG